MLQQLSTRLFGDYANTKRWVVCLSAGLFFFYDFIQLNMFNTLNPYLVETFRLDAVEIGYLASSYFFANVCMLPFCGALLDRYSIRKIILNAMFVCILSALLLSIATNIWTAVIARILCGASTAFCFLSCIVLSTRWFPADKMAQVTGIIVTMAMIGGMFSQEPLAHLILQLGWRHTLLLDTGLGVFLWGVMYYTLEDHPKGWQALKPNREPVMSSYRKALGNNQNIICGLYTSLMNLFIFILGATWGISYLQHVYHMNVAEASRITMMLFFGTIFGSPLAGYYSDTIRKRRFPMILGAVVSFSLAFLLLFRPDFTPLQFSVVFFIIGFATSTQIISYPVIYETNHPSITGASEGLAAVLIMGGGAIFPPLFGWIMQQHWSGLMVDGLPKYSGGDYHLAYLILPITLFICIFLAKQVKETNCQPLWIKNTTND